MLFCQPSCKHFAWEPPLLHRLAANYKNNVRFWTVFFVKLFLWPGELQYWQACRKKFSKMLAKNWSMSQFSEKILSFSKKICSENVFMATYYAVLTTSSENFRQKANKFSLDVRGWYFYCEKNFFTKFFEWTRRIYFSQHRRKHFDRKCSAQHRKLMKKCLILTERKSFFGIFWWTRRSQFRHKPVKNLIAKVQQFSRNVQKRWIMCTIFSMKFFSQNVLLDTTMIALLTIPLEKFQLKDRTFRSLCEYVIIQMFWSIEKTPSNCSCGRVEGNFDNPAESKKTKGRKNSVQWPEMLKTFIFYNFFLLKIFPQTGSIQFWQRRRKTIDRKTGIFWLMSQKK